MTGRRLAAFLSACLAASSALPTGARAGSISRVDDSKKVNVLAAQQSFFLPGLGQWGKGYKWKGAGIGGLELFFLGGAYHSYTRARLAEEDFRRGRASYGRYTRKADQGNFFLVGAAVTWLFAVADAYVSPPAGTGSGPSAGVDAEGAVRVAWSVRF